MSKDIKLTGGNNMDSKSVLKVVRDKYGAIARQQNGCGCGCACDSGAGDYAKSLGYSEDELNNIPDEANLALSCGNPTAIANLNEGEVVLDLGSGAGFDCFLAASKVGASGSVIGVDMTPEMLEKARAIAVRENFGNVEFRLGEIENLPVADNTVDVIISNCVINLSANKERVFREIHRVLKSGGRVAISDVALLKDLPKETRSSIEAYVGCIAGAVHLEDYKQLVDSVGLKNIQITASGNSFAAHPDSGDPRVGKILESLTAGLAITDYVASVYVEAQKE